METFVNGERVEETYWNGQPAQARKVTLVVADAPEFPLYWARDLVGTRRDAVEVTYDGHTFYLDDADYEVSAKQQEAFRARFGDVRGLTLGRSAGMGWAKVTEGHGSPRWSHGDLTPEPGSVEPRVETRV